MNSACTPSAPHSMTAGDWHRRLDPLIDQAIHRRVFSAASLLVAEGGSVRFEGTWGRCQFGGPPVTAATRFDLASLTKPLATAIGLMKLVSSARLDLDEPLQHLLPRASLPPDKRSIRLRQLLNHSSGLPAYRPYFKDLIGVPPKLRRPALLSWILAEPLEQSPGRRACYSDLGFMLLGILLEDVFALPLPSLFGKDQAGAAHPPTELGYVPLRSAAPATLPARPEPPAASEFAATEQCPWRNRLLVGEVDDENAYCLDGVAGHAGLFGTARSVYHRLRQLTAAFLGEATAAAGLGLDPDTVRRFWSRSDSGAPAGSTWLLGFDTPSPQGSSAGRWFSPHSIGHLGFTGTSFWVDLDRDITVVFFTNRVHPTRHNDQLQPFRPLLHDTVMECLDAH